MHTYIILRNLCLHSNNLLQVITVDYMHGDVMHKLTVDENGRVRLDNQEIGLVDENGFEIGNSK